MNILKFAPIILLLMLVFIIGCSGASDTPTQPAANGGDGLAPSVAAPERRQAGDAYASSHYLWGYFLIAVSDDHREAEIIPLREVTQHFNVLYYLESSPCTNCVKIVSKEFPGGGLINFGIQLRHPFPGQGYFTGFDVRGIGIFNAHGTFPAHNLKYSIGGEGDGEIVNPDGFTHLYHVATQGSGPDGFKGYIKGSMSSPQAPDGTLNAFKNYYSSENRHFFLAGDVKQVIYTVDPPKGVFVFGYAVDANWAIPQNQPVQNIPDDFGLNANCPEAYQVSATVGDGLTTSVGSAEVEIWVYDWQGFSTIKSVRLEAPDLFTSTVDAAFDSVSGNYVVYSATISNNLQATEGSYDLLVAVEDTANDSAPDYLDLTAYQIVKAEVVQGIPNQPPVAIAEADTTEVMAGEEVHFDASASYDPEDGGITKWKWDCDGDGVFGNDFEGTAYAVWTFDDVGEFDVDLEVWDSLNATGTLDSKIHIVVSGDPCIGHTPTAIAKADDYNPNIDVQVQFTDLSTDPDGPGDKAYWWWELDGNGIDPPVYDPEMQHPKHTYDTGGDYYVYLKVSDLIGCIDELDEPLIVEVNGPPLAEAHADKYVITVGEYVLFTTDASDPDGNGPLETYEWDLDGDGTYESAGPIAEWQYWSPGFVYVQHGVWDVKGLYDDLDAPLVIQVNPPPDVVIHLSEEEAMCPIGAEYVFFNRFDSVGGTSIINYLDFDGPWDFTGILPNGTFFQDIIDKDDSTVSSWNSNWPSVQYYVRQEGPSAQSGTILEAYGALARFYTSPPDDGDQYTYGIYDVTQGFGAIKFNPYNVLQWPLDKFTNQHDAFTWNPEGLTLETDVWTTALGQGAAIIDVDGIPTPFPCLFLKVRQKDVWDSGMGKFVIGDTVSYRWLADDGTEIAAITAINGFGSPDNWNAGSGLITGMGCIRWLNYYTF